MFRGFIGQQRIVRELGAIADSLIKNNNESVNILFRGSAGCGKTMLARLFCKEISGRAFSYQTVKNEVLMTPNIIRLRSHIIDEAHNINNFEVIYELLDSEKYILVFCTTEAGVLPDPFTSRCLSFTFEKYEEDDIANILVDYSMELGFPIAKDTGLIIATRARGSPRVAKKYLKRIKFIIDKGYYPKTVPGIVGAFHDIGVFKGGYTDVDIKYLKFIANLDRASLNTISRGMGLDKNTIVNDIEPFLLDRGHITISNRGREFISWKAVLNKGEIRE